MIYILLNILRTSLDKWRGGLSVQKQSLSPWLGFLRRKIKVHIGDKEQRMMGNIRVKLASIYRETFREEN